MAQHQGAHPPNCKEGISQRGNQEAMGNLVVQNKLTQTYFISSFLLRCINIEIML